ncbi:MAG: hypothetical protein ACO2PO_15855 [Candidatus Calescibacterium sp.]
MKELQTQNQTFEGGEAMKPTENNQGKSCVDDKENKMFQVFPPSLEWVI